jgi:hypothetical protein
MIIADARFDRDSFGASENDRLGYFPQAFFDVSLRSEFSFTAAFKGAVTQVSQREQREGKTPSEPQIYEGAHIGTQLRRLEDRLRSPAAHAAVNGTGPQHRPRGCDIGDDSPGSPLLQGQAHVICATLPVQSRCEKKRPGSGFPLSGPVARREVFRAEPN